MKAVPGWTLGHLSPDSSGPPGPPGCGLQVHRSISAHELSISFCVFQLFSAFFKSLAANLQ